VAIYIPHLHYLCGNLCRWLYFIIRLHEWRNLFYNWQIGKRQVSTLSGLHCYFMPTALRRMSRLSITRALTSFPRGTLPRRSVPWFPDTRLFISLHLPLLLVSLNLFGSSFNLPASLITGSLGYYFQRLRGT